MNSVSFLSLSALNIIAIINILFANLTESPTTYIYCFAIVSLLITITVFYHRKSSNVEKISRILITTICLFIVFIGNLVYINECFDTGEKRYIDVYIDSKIIPYSRLPIDIGERVVYFNADLNGNGNFEYYSTYVSREEYDKIKSGDLAIIIVQDGALGLKHYSLLNLDTGTEI